MAGFVRKWRGPVNKLAVPLVLIVDLVSFVVIPILNYDRKEVWATANFSIPGEDEVGFAPLDSTFINGMLIGPDGVLNCLDWIGLWFWFPPHSASSP